MGFGTKQGCEAAVLSLRQYVHDEEDGEKIIVKIVYKNAFNSFERDSLLSEVRANVPSLYNNLWQFYANTSYLYFNAIESLVGAQQGDSTGPLTFSLAIHPIFKETQIRTECLVSRRWHSWSFT